MLNVTVGADEVKDGVSDPAKYSCALLVQVLPFNVPSLNLHFKSIS